MTATGQNKSRYNVVKLLVYIATSQQIFTEHNYI